VAKLKGIKAPKKTVTASGAGSESRR
jgi:hypothetical protein